MFGRKICSVQGAFLGVVVPVFLISACSQDPYADKRETIQKALVPSSEKPSAVVDEQNLNIDASFDSFADSLEVFETERVEFQLTGRVLLPGVKGRVVIENLADLPGAVFSEKSGTFIWTPERGIVGNEQDVKVSLAVRIFTAADSERPALTKSRHIPIRIKRLIEDPEIKEVYGVSEGQQVEEGDQLNIRVRVKDFGVAKGELKPFLMFSSVSDSDGRNIPVDFTPNLAYPDKSAPGIWEFSGTIHIGEGLGRRTSAGTKRKIILVAASTLGRVSKPYEFTIGTIPRIPDVRSDMTTDTLPVFSGQQFSRTIRFWVPDERLTVELPSLVPSASFQELPDKPLWTCGYVQDPSVPSGRDFSQVSCTIVFNAPEAITARTKYAFEVRTKASRGTIGGAKKETRFTFQVEVIP